jgi:tRNA A-37 threonylcarbamoyl transferase component Bud32
MNELSPPKQIDGREVISVLNRGGWANGDVYRVVIDGQQAVLKTYRDKPLIIQWLGRYLLSRERRAYAALQGIPGIPDVLPGAQGLSLAMQQIDGERISHEALKARGDQIIPALTRLIDAMHERGVYHMDLRNQGNILVDAENQPNLLDFASSVIVRGRNPLSALIARACRRFDLYGLSKWRGRWRMLTDPAKAD